MSKYIVPSIILLVFCSFCCCCLVLVMLAPESDTETNSKPSGVVINPALENEPTVVDNNPLADIKLQFEEGLQQGQFKVELLFDKKYEDVLYITDGLLKEGKCLMSSSGGDLKGDWQNIEVCIMFSDEDGLPFIIGFEKYSSSNTDDFCEGPFSTYKTDDELLEELLDINPLDYCEPKGNYAEYYNCSQNPVSELRVNCYEEDFNMTVQLRL